MKMIVTTSQSVLLLDGVTGDATVLHRGAGLYYGIARVGGRYAVAARRRSVAGPTPRPDERGCILLLDPELRSVRTLEAPFPLRDMHQVAWFDDRLWVTCSFDDMVAVYDGERWERWYPLPLPDAEASDRYHFNSFRVTEAEIALLAHNHGPSDLHFFDRRTRAWRRTIRLGEQAHDIWIEGDAYATCSSIQGKLVATSGWERPTGAFPRGVCITPIGRAVGLSALTERGNRDWTSGAVALCDAAWRPLHYVHLPHEGMVLDLVAVADGEARSIEAAFGPAVRFPLLPRVSDADLAGA